MSDITLPRTGPSINKGRSRQDYETPWEFIRAVEAKLGKITCDLAASRDNHKAPVYYTIAQDSLANGALWCPMGICWLNPPFGVIGPWAKKCWDESQLGARIVMLTPASVGSNWFRDYVHNRARVLFLSPRIQFECADDPYPKDLMLSCFGWSHVGYECWRWK